MSTIVVELYQALREAGVGEQLARDAAHAVLGTDMKNELATKADLAQLSLATKADLAQLSLAVKADIAALETRLVAEIAGSRVEMIKWAVGAMTALSAIFAAISRLG